MAQSPFLLLPGFLCDKRLWRHQTDFLKSKGIPFAVPDLRHSSSVEEMVDAAIESAQDAGFREFHLVGFSMGGYVAQALCSDFPETVASLTLIASSGGVLSEKEIEARLRVASILENARYKGIGESELARYIHPSALLKAEPGKTIREMSADNTSEMYLAQMRATLHREDYRSKLRDKGKRIEIIAGENDRVVPLVEMTELQRSLPGSRLHRVPNCGHYVPLEKPSMVNQALSTLFSTALLALSFALPLAPAHAFDPTLFANPSPASHRTSIRLSGEHQPTDRVRNARIEANTPIYKKEDRSVILGARFDTTDFRPGKAAEIGNLVRPGGRSIDRLTDAEARLGYNRILPRNRSLAFSTSFGSSSDRAFRSGSNTIGGTVLYSRASSPQSRWTFGMNYSNNRPILNNIPLPFFIYSYTPSRNFSATLGAPFASIYWNPTNPTFRRWSLLAFVVVPWIAKAQVAYSVLGPAQIYAGLDFTQRTFLPDEREASKERLFHAERKIFIGARSPLSPNLFLDLEAGRAHARELFMAERYTRDPRAAVSLDSSLYAKISLRILL